MVKIHSMIPPAYGSEKQKTNVDTTIPSSPQLDGEEHTSFQEENSRSDNQSMWWRGLLSCFPAICGLGKNKDIDGSIEEAEPLLKNEKSGLDSELDLECDAEKNGNGLEEALGSLDGLDPSELQISALLSAENWQDMSPEEALKKALSIPESAAALNNELLQAAFLEAAKLENFQQLYFYRFENIGRLTFRWRLGQGPASRIYDPCLTKVFKEAIEEQEKDSPPLTMKLLPSVNQNRRGKKDAPTPITHIVLHHTATETTDAALKTLRSGLSGVSAHYLIGHEPEVICLVADKDRSWHGGNAFWHGKLDINSCSLGIEIVNPGNLEFPEEQIDALLLLLERLKKRYNIHEYDFLGHLDFAPDRKIDPGIWFPWKQLGERGFGLWLKKEDLQNKLPDDFEIANALSKIGYKVDPLENSIKAFSQHFLQKEQTELNEDEKLILHSLAAKADRRNQVESPLLHHVA